MKKEDLIELGLDEGQVDGVFKIRGKEIEEHKTLITSLQTEKENSDTAKTNAEALVEEIKKSYVLPEDLDAVKGEKKALETKIEELVSTHETEVNKINFDNVLDSTLSSSGAKNLKLVKLALNKDNLKYEEGKIQGLEEEILNLKGTDGYLFYDKEEANKPKYSGRQEDSGKSVSKGPFDAKLAKYGR